MFAFLMKVENLTFPEAVRTLARELRHRDPRDATAASGGLSERVFAANAVAQAALPPRVRRARAIWRRAYLAGARPLGRRRASASRSASRPTRWDARGARAAQRARIPARDRRAAPGLLRARAARRRPLRPAARPRHVPDPRRARPRVGFGGRALAAGQEPKYLNTPESPVFRKREAFYGLPRALEAIRRADRAVVVEGYFDRIALARAGRRRGARHLRHRAHARSTRARCAAARATSCCCSTATRPASARCCARSRCCCRPACACAPRCCRRGADPDDLLAREGARGAARASSTSAPAALDFAIERAVARRRGSPAEKADAVGGGRAAARARSRPASSAATSRSGSRSRSAPRRADVEAAVRAAQRGERRARRACRSRRAAARRRGAQARACSRAAWSSIPAWRRSVPRDEVAELRAGRPAARADRRAARSGGAEARSVPLEELAARARAARGAAVLRQLAVGGRRARAEPTAARAIDDTLDWLRRSARSERSARSPAACAIRTRTCRRFSRRSNALTRQRSSG